MTPERVQDYDLAVAKSVSRILGQFPECGRSEGAIAIKKVIQKAIELAKPFGAPSPKREEAKRYFADVAHLARDLELALRNPQYAVFTQRDVPQFATISEFGGSAVSCDALANMLSGLSKISQHRQSLISSGKGDFRLSEEYGFPAPHRMVAVFVILFWHRMRGNMPDRRTGGAILVCDEIWRCVSIGMKQVGDGDHNAAEKWIHHLHEARAGIKEINDRPRVEAAWHEMARSEDPDERKQALSNPVGAPSRQMVANQNAVQLASVILDEAGVPVVDRTIM